MSMTVDLRGVVRVRLWVLCSAVAAAAATSPAAGAVPGHDSVIGFELADVVPGSGGWGLSSPEDLAVDHRGRIVIADTGNHRVVVVSREGKLVTEFGGYGWGEGEFDGPTGISVYPGFYIYVLDQGNRRVQRFDKDGDFVDIVLDEDQAGSPVGIDVGQLGELLLVDLDSQTVLKWSQFDEELDPVGRFGTGEGGLVVPRDVAVGPQREIAVADPGRGSVEVFDEFGAHLCALTTPDTLAAERVVFEPRGGIVVAEPSRARILAFDRRGGPATASYDGAALGMRPGGLAFDGEGHLLVLDRAEGRVFVFRVIYGNRPSGR